MLQMEIGWEGAFSQRVEYVAFGEGPDEGVDRLLYASLTYTEDFVGSTHMPFAEALEEVMRVSGLTEDLAREALLRRPSPEDGEWRYGVHSHPLDERRPTLDEAEKRARVLSAALGCGYSSVVDEGTGEVLADYHRESAEYRAGDIPGALVVTPERRASEAADDGGPTTTNVTIGLVSMDVIDPNAVPYPTGPLWERLGHELVYGNEPAEVAAKHGADAQELARLSDLFWRSFSRMAWLSEANELGFLGEALRLNNDALQARLAAERSPRNQRS